MHALNVPHFNLCIRNLFESTRTVAEGNKGNRPSLVLPIHFIRPPFHRKRLLLDSIRPVQASSNRMENTTIRNNPQVSKKPN